LYEDFPAADLGLYSYRTRFGRLKFWESIPVEQEAEIFAHNLRDLPGYKNIILIAYSMGGLVALKAITYLVEMHTPSACYELSYEAAAMVSSRHGTGPEKSLTLGT
jgi:hypothetical protein